MCSPPEPPKPPKAAGSIDAGAFNENIKIKMQIKPGKRKHLNLTHNCPGNRPKDNRGTKGLAYKMKWLWVTPIPVFIAQTAYH